jgi:hypothetical protein
MEMKIFFLFGVKDGMMRKKNNAKNRKITSLGMPTHPLLLSSNVRFPFLTHVLISAP